MAKRILPSNVELYESKGVRSIKINSDNFKELIYSLEEIVYPGRLERLAQTTLHQQKKLVDMGLEPEQVTTTLIATMAGEAFREAVALTLAIIAMLGEKPVKDPDKPLNPREIIKRIK